MDSFRKWVAVVSFLGGLMWVLLEYSGILSSIFSSDVLNHILVVRNNAGNIAKVEIHTPAYQEPGVQEVAANASDIQNKDIAPVVQDSGGRKKNIPVHPKEQVMKPPAPSKVFGDKQNKADRQSRLKGNAQKAQSGRTSKIAAGQVPTPRVDISRRTEDIVPVPMRRPLIAPAPQQLATPAPQPLPIPAPRVAVSHVSKELRQFLQETALPGEPAGGLSPSQQYQAFRYFEEGLPLFKRAVLDYKHYVSGPSGYASATAVEARKSMRQFLALYDKHAPYLSSYASSNDLVEQYAVYIKVGRRIVESE